MIERSWKRGDSKYLRKINSIISLLMVTQTFSFVCAHFFLLVSVERVVKVISTGVQGLGRGPERNFRGVR